MSDERLRPAVIERSQRAGASHSPAAGVSSPTVADSVRSDSVPSPRPVERGILAVMAALTAALHLPALTQYGWFRDELYYLASTAHLDWGFVDHPPLSIAILAIVHAICGESLIAVRLVPLAAGIATVWLTGALAARLGGGRFAQGLAALATVLAPVVLGTDHYYSMNAFDLLLWVIAAHAALTALDRRTLGAWSVLGVVLGLGLLNKLSMLWLGAGLAAALVLTPHRRALATPRPLLAGAIALAIFAPNVVWEIRHHWPTLVFMHNATTQKMASTSTPEFLKAVVLEMNLGAAWLWLLGLVAGLWPAGRGAARGADRGSGRVFAIVFLVAAAIVMSTGKSRPSYLAVAFPPLLALGAVAAETFSARRAWLRVGMVLAIVLFGAVTLPFAMPILPVETFVRYQSALGLAPHTDERQEMGALPQQYADMFGWPEMVDLVAKAYARLTPEERKHARVFGQNYGEAGAVDVLGRKLGLPHALSGHNSYGVWGPGDFDGSVLIVIGGDRKDNAEFFDEIEIVGQTSSPWSMPYERGLDVWIGRKPKVDLRAAWPKLVHFI